MKPTIFVVEDTDDIGYLLDYFLTEEGYTVKVFSNLSDFYLAYENELPDLFLLDIMLPDGDGLELCKDIRKNARSEKIPILMMSAHASSEAMSNESCADGFFLKPFSLTELSEKVSSFFEGYSASINNR
jgi:DNA-binding response OmpR family regulator